MSTIRNSSPSADADAKRAEAAKQAEQAQPTRAPTRQPAAPESVDQFRSLLQQRQGGFAQAGTAGKDEGLARLLGQSESAADGGKMTAEQVRAEAGNAVARKQAAGERAHEHQRQSVGFERVDSAPPPAESSAMLQAQLAMRDTATPPPAAQPTSNASAFADLIERHVRQLAVSNGGASGEQGQVLLRLSDQTLPGTDLLLTKTAEGWQLRADSRSRSSYDAIRDAGPELARRFAERNLGQLSIDPHFHD
ncbi:hypothetical protein [Lysobacter capsici]|jgi:hypothetical protein|uniref:hypothetical protein n=1 Tax=Lysobacter capsici TaxID=435897 RepID=UPI00287BAD62|nr:hypothetical protein [Lysobacter capsici]WND80987.1 hypothetical protein RJ610_01010 [Lysobacter capsici]WND86183.1 hypothetical protein RJ609_01010 [Lysobacter capsici]